MTEKKRYGIGVRTVDGITHSFPNAWGHAWRSTPSESVPLGSDRWLVVVTREKATVAFNGEHVVWVRDERNMVQ